jgi:hypothetical protein
MLAADPAERLADRWMLGVQRLPGDTAGACDSRDTAAQLGQHIALAGRRKIGPDDLRRRRHRLEAMPVAPSPVFREVSRVGAQRGWGIRDVLVGLPLGERDRRACRRGLGAAQAGELTLPGIRERVGHMPQ